MTIPSDLQTPCHTFSLVFLALLYYAQRPLCLLVYTGYHECHVQYVPFALGNKFRVFIKLGCPFNLTAYAPRLLFTRHARSRAAQCPGAMIPRLLCVVYL